MRIVFQGGDNMLGRAVQLTLPYRTHGDTEITDSQSAQDYLNDILPGVNIDEIRKQNIDGTYLWGDMPYDLGENVRILNLEVAPTLSVYHQDVPRKGIHYHMNINNLFHIFSKFSRPYILSLANNHSMDMGRTAFITETLPYISNAVGIGINNSTAHAPKIIGNIAICAFGAACSGVPEDWEATIDKPGMAYLPEITNETNVNISFDIISNSIREIINKCIIISIHWGPNWASNNDYQKYRELLAHRLIDEANVSIIYGHSSHHIRGLELYKGKLIMYGAGDFVNDYEEIPTDSSKYDTTSALYIVDLDNNDYTIKDITLIPFHIKELRCKMIVDPNKIKSWRSFVNRQSVRDSLTPLLI